MKQKFVKQFEVLMIILSCVLIGGTSYMIGTMKINESQGRDIQIIYPAEIAMKMDDTQGGESVQNVSSKQTNISTGQIVASKNGTRYYYSHCTGINRIKEENKVYFQSKEEAEARGLTLASACKPL